MASGMTYWQNCSASQKSLKFLNDEPTQALIQEMDNIFLIVDL